MTDYNIIGIMSSNRSFKGNDRVVTKDKRIEDLKDIYMELDENKKKKMEQLAVGLFEVQTIIEDEKSKVITDEDKKE